MGVLSKERILAFCSGFGAKRTLVRDFVSHLLAVSVGELEQFVGVRRQQVGGGGPNRPRARFAAADEDSEPVNLIEFAQGG